MKTVNLEEILRKHSNICLDDQEAVIEAMREACIKAIELAAENASLSESIIGNSFIDNESILNTKSQII